MRLGVLVSGAGSNLQALIDRVHQVSASIVGVCSSNHEAYALERARAAGIESAVFALAAYTGEPARRDRAMAEWLTQREVGLVVCAGYMGVLSAGFLARFPARVLNVHPSLLPAFPGASAIEDAVRSRRRRDGRDGAPRRRGAGRRADRRPVQPARQLR